MELVYLWVEDYKNIQKQGFNFSPRFECKYENDELTICDKKKNECEDNNYIENFFGDNINVTAIVGKNGSGKSSLLEFLLLKNRNNYIFIYQKQDFIYINNPYCELKIKNNISYSISEKKDIKYNDNNDIKMIFSFAEYITRDNHPKYDDKKGNVILLGQRTNIANYPKDKFNCLLQKLRVNHFDTVEIRDIARNKLKINNILYKDLSFGETLLISLFINISIRIEKEKLNILFLDEVTLPFHPTWEKRIIKLFIEIFHNENIHFIITSHSPFLLSDIPKQNIIFLDKYKEEDKEVKSEKQKIGNCKVVDGLNQTFGANIHTLLSDSFFMEDGLMGEFAKGKINEIIAFFNNENELYKNDKDKLFKIINTIGEPFLKDKLLFMYNEKYPKTDDEKILELEKKIESIKNGRD
jgi:ABC-type lipoprotein export system ATPase subunit